MSARPPHAAAAPSQGASRIVLRSRATRFADALADCKLDNLRAADAEQQLAYRRGYVHGWRWGTVCGFVVGMLATFIACASLGGRL